MTIVARDLNGQPIPAVRPGATSGAAYTASAASVGPFSSTTRVVRVVCTTDAFIALKALATTADMFLPAGMVEYFRVDLGDTVSAVQSTAAGVLYVTECR